MVACEYGTVVANLERWWHASDHAPPSVWARGWASEALIAACLAPLPTSDLLGLLGEEAGGVAGRGALRASEVGVGRCFRHARTI